jgi:TDP-D-fucosamine acetyltransferase
MPEHRDALRFLARRNEWESRFFEREIWTLSRDEDGDRTASEHIKARPNVQLWECSTALCEEADIRELMSSSFFLCDASVDFVFDLSDGNTATFPTFPEGIQANLAAEADIPQLESLIAERAFQSRFGRAPFSPSDSRKFYSVWARNAVLGAFDNLCGVLRRAGEVIGFVTLRDIELRGARIGLIVTSAQHKRLGVGEWLWTYAAHLASQRGKVKLHMATQMSNRNAIALCLSRRGQPAGTRAHFYHAKDMNLSGAGQACRSPAPQCTSDPGGTGKPANY